MVQLLLAILILTSTRDMQGIEKEYAELDTVWFMAGSLFNGYPYDIPTEAFPLKLFQQVGFPCVLRCLHITAAWLSVNHSNAEKALRPAGFCSSAGQCGPSTRSTSVKAICIGAAWPSFAVLLFNSKGTSSLPQLSGS